ncbi:MAG: phosphate acetyltransferase [Firmicutes bacterium]|nr:phosphate acetyltransferase [Bacillota bacterium]
MDLVTQIREKARAQHKHIVLPEGTEKRTVAAAAVLTKEAIAQVTLLGSPEKINAVAAAEHVDLSGVAIIDPEKDEHYTAFAEEFCQMRAKKGMTMDKALETMKNPLYFGVMMVYKDICDGMVAGAENATGDVLRPALQIIKTRPGITTVSGAFIMVTQDAHFGKDGIMIFADCAVNPTLTDEQMAEVAYCSAQTAQKVVGMENPKVAMLSFSTKGSAKHELVDKVASATAIAKERYPELLVDGEMQLDAAVVPSVGEFKAPGSPVAGHADVLIFPDLQAGNACYKAVQRFGHANAVGPVLQGMAKPVNDLSRGCSVEDIVNTVALVSCQA